MRTHTKLMAVGLLASALTTAGVAGYLAWNSLTGEAELKAFRMAANPVSATPTPIPVPIQTTQPAQVTPVAQPAQNTTAAQVQPQTTQRATASQTSWSVAENNYLYDLSQALQPVEHQRLGAAEQLEIARQIQAWLTDGADYWAVRDRFDANYHSQIAGDYGHNREVYIKFSTQHFAPEAIATLMPPVEQRQPYREPNAAPYLMPYPQPHFGYDPYAEPYPMPYPEPDMVPYPQASIPYDPPYGSPYPDRYQDQYPNQHPQYPQYPNQYSERYPSPNQPDLQPPDSRRENAIPNVTEVVARPERL